MAEKKKLVLEVVGNDDDLRSFVNVMAFINECTRIGHHGNVDLHVDGDGSASVAIFDQSSGELIMSEDYQVMHALDEGNIWIGE